MTVLNERIRKLSQNINSSRPSLFCVPGIFGSPHYLINLSRQLGPQQPFYSWQQAQLCRSKPDYYSVENIAGQYIKDLKDIQAKDPYYLAGHSFGGLIAFEMAQQLREHNERVAVVIIFDSAAPLVEQKQQLSQSLKSFNDRDYIDLMLEMFRNIFGDTLIFGGQNNFNQNLDGRLEELQIFFDFLSPEESIPPQQWFQLFKNNWQAMADYTPRRAIDTPLLLYRAAETSRGKITDIVFEQAVIDNPSYGWAKLTNELKLHLVSGNHSSMLALPHVKFLAPQLKDSLNTYMAEYSTFV